MDLPQSTTRDDTCGGWNHTSTSETARNVIELYSAGLIHTSRKNTAGINVYWVVFVVSGCLQELLIPVHVLLVTTSLYVQPTIYDNNSGILLYKLACFYCMFPAAWPGSSTDITHQQNIQQLIIFYIISILAPPIIHISMAIDVSLSPSFPPSPSHSCVYKWIMAQFPLLHVQQLGPSYCT